MKLRTAAILLSVFTIGFLLMLWRGSRQQSTKSPLENAAENVIQARIKYQIAHDALLIQDAQVQQTQQEFDSLATRIYRGDTSLATQRDSLRAVIERRVQDSLRVRATRQRAAIPETQTPALQPAKSL